MRYFVKTIAGEESGRHFIMWEYDSLTAFEGYKKQRADYPGPYAEYKEKTIPSTWEFSFTAR